MKIRKNGLETFENMGKYQQKNGAKNENNGVEKIKRKEGLEPFRKIGEN